MEAGDVDAGDAGVGGIEARVFAGGVRVEGVEAGVVAAEDLRVVAEQLLAVAGGLDAEFGLLDVVERQAGDGGELGGDGVELSGRQGVTLVECGGVFAPGKFACLLDPVLQRAVVRNLVVVPGDGRIAGQIGFGRTSDC